MRWKRVLICLMPCLGMLSACAWLAHSAKDDSKDILPLLPPPNLQTRLYNPDPRHPWNLLHSALMMREAKDGKVYGEDISDPLLWAESTYLLDGEARARAAEALNAALAGGSAKADPLRRAVLQSDAWAIFDWAGARDADLAGRLAKLMSKVALTPDEIQHLPDTYAAAIASKHFPTAYDPAMPQQAFLPPDLFQEHGSWVAIEVPAEPVALVHTRFVSGRSFFTVLIRLPGGRQAALDYLKSLRGYPARERGPGEGMLGLQQLNPDMPQFPAGTQVALVRQMMLVDSAGSLRVTPLVQMIQMRVYQPLGDAVFEFRLSREALFAGKAGGLRPVEAGEREFVQFVALPHDQIDRPLGSRGTLDLAPVFRCNACHREPGVFSFFTYTRTFHPGSPRFPPVSASEDTSSLIEKSLAWKRQQEDWELYRGLMRVTLPRPPRN